MRVVHMLIVAVAIMMLGASLSEAAELDCTGELCWENQQLNQKMKDRVAKSLQPWAHRKISFADLQANVDGQHGTIELVAIIDHKVYLNNTAVHPLVIGKHTVWYRQLSQVLLW